MLRISRILLAAAAMIALGAAQARAQAVSAAGAAVAGADQAPDRTAVHTPEHSPDHSTDHTSDNAAAQSAAPAAAPDTRTEKQKALAMQTERLFNMATELKAQVDRTNKNILSLKVVEKAEEIEALAKGLRAQAKK